ncbi:MAG: metal transporter CNNM [Glaciecola sp.]|jgi:metal transporter CNNM
MTQDIVIWLAIAFCITQSAIFSGLNIAFFSLSRLQLEVETKQGNENAATILAMREDSNFLLSTILWGNVSINVLLTLLSDSVLVGVYSFLFSAVAITFLGEIFPQAYFSRNALRVASKLTPIIKFYQVLLYPVAKLTALILDGWLGREGITYFREKELSALIHAHVESEETDVEHVRGIGALNFLQIDKVTVNQEGELLDPKSMIKLPCKLDLPILPEKGTPEYDEFVSNVNASGHKWVLLLSEEEQPLLMIDADGFIRSTLDESIKEDAYSFCHRPLIVHNEHTTLGDALQRLKVAHALSPQSEDVLHSDVILVWSSVSPRVITGADILGRLLKGIGDGLGGPGLEDDKPPIDMPEHLE